MEYRGLEIVQRGQKFYIKNLKGSGRRVSTSREFDGSGYHFIPYAKDAIDEWHAKYERIFGHDRFGQ